MAKFIRKIKQCSKTQEMKSIFLGRWRFYQKTTEVIGYTGGGGKICLFCYELFGIKWKKYSVVWFKPVEKTQDWTTNNLAQSINSPDLYEKMKILLKGLNKDSKITACRIISALHNTKNKNVLATLEEAKECVRIQTEFYPNIIDISKNIYCYNGYFLPVRHFEVGVFWHKHGLEYFHANTLAKLRQKDIIDVGGFVGDSALIFLEYTDKKIYSFEATMRNYELMLQTLVLNDVHDRIVPVCKGLGASEKNVEILLDGSASSMLYPNTGQTTETISVITLDSYVKEHNIEVGFIKVDIEGYEMEFLQGALETITTQKPALLISIYHQGSDFFTIKPFLESLNLGYTFQIIKTYDGQLSIETALFCEVLDVD